MDEWLEDQTLQAIAAENNLSETAFVIPGPECSPLRWFTPIVEMDLCGHATLATAHILFQEHYAEQTHLRFETRSGTLAVSRNDHLLYLDFPSRPGEPVTIDETLIEALGRTPVSAIRARDLMVVFETEAEVRDFSPRLLRHSEPRRVCTHNHRPGGRGGLPYPASLRGCRGARQTLLPDSAHCTLIPYGAKRLGKTALSARQLSSRGGELACELRGDRVLIGGQVIEYMRGEICVGPAS